MRASPAAQFTLIHFGVWRGAVALVSAGVAAVFGAWLLLEGSPAASMPWPVRIGMVAPLCLWLAGVQPRNRAMCLRWDGRLWHLGPATAASGEPCAGTLAVAVDLGVWMLLRFHPFPASSGTGPTWVPAQRRGHADQWHALRCAVYSPRPDAGADGAPDV